MPCAMVMKNPGMKNASGVTSAVRQRERLARHRRQRQQRAGQHHGLGRERGCRCGVEMRLPVKNPTGNSRKYSPNSVAGRCSSSVISEADGARHHHEGAGVEAALQHEGVEAQPAEQRDVALQRRSSPLLVRLAGGWVSYSHQIGDERDRRRRPAARSRTRCASRTCRSARRR